MTSNKIFKGLFILLAFFAVVSCDTDIIDGNGDGGNNTETELPSSLIGTYDGAITYTGSDGTVVIEDDAEAKISKSGDTYKISFNYGVPSLENLLFAEDDGEYATIGTDGSASGIVLDHGDLDIGVVKSGNNWAFSGTK